MTGIVAQEGGFKAAGNYFLIKFLLKDIEISTPRKTRHFVIKFERNV